MHTPDMTSIIGLRVGCHARGIAGIRAISATLRRSQTQVFRAAQGLRAAADHALRRMPHIEPVRRERNAFTGKAACGSAANQSGYGTTKLIMATKCSALPTKTKPCQMAWW